MSSGDTAEYVLVQELHTDEARYAGLVLCVNVTNTKAVRQSVLSGDLPCCLLDASMVSRGGGGVISKLSLLKVKPS